MVGGFAAWTPTEREIEDTDHSVLRILAGQTAAALQNAALLDHSARLHARTARQAADLKARNTELLATQAELGAARQREVLDDERHRIARELHDSVTQYALSAGMHIELVRSEIDDDRLRAQLDTAKDLTRRAVEQLRSAIYALNDEHARGRGPPVHAAQAVAGCTCPTSCPSRCASAASRWRCPPSASSRCSASRARRCSTRPCTARRAARSCGWPTRAPRVRLTISDDGDGRPEEVRRSLRAASAAPSGEHRGLVNMQAGPASWAARWRSGGPGSVGCRCRWRSR